MYFTPIDVTNDLTLSVNIKECNVGGNVTLSEEIYNRDLVNGDFSISDLYIKAQTDTIFITEAKIIINNIEYSAEITTNDNEQLLTFLSDNPVTIFNVNEMKDLDTSSYIYTFTI